MHNSETALSSWYVRFSDLTICSAGKGNRGSFQIHIEKGFPSLNFSFFHDSYASLFDNRVELKIGCEKK
jgi:hypothetical protein